MGMSIALFGGGDMNWINVIVVLLLTTLATVFALANNGPIQLHFIGFTSIKMPLFVPMFIALLLGFLGGLLALSFSRRKHKIEIRRLRQENELLQKEVDNLRNLPLQDEV